MRLDPLLALPPIALGIAAAVWMISSAPGPVQVEVGPPGQSVRVLTVVPEDLRPVTSAWGNLRAAETWVAVAEVQGEVVFRHPDLEPGRLVPAGTEVLRIDPADYELALAQAEADLDGLAAEQDQVKAEAANTARILELERERLALAEADLERTLTLAKQGTVPQARADEATRATLLARRAVAELENTLALVPVREARTAAQLAKTQASRDRSERALARTVLTAPFDSRVTDVNAEQYQTVAPGQVIIRADNIDTAEVVVHLPVSDFRRLIGQVAADMTAAGMMRNLPVAQIEATLSPLSDPAQVWSAQLSRVEGALDARARTVPVVVQVNDPYEGADPPRRLPLVPNMQVQVTLTGVPMTGIIAIPEAALHGGTVRLVGPGDRLELRPVMAAFVQDGRVVIAEGLVPGDRVVIDDIAPAIPGMALTPVEAVQ